VKDVYAIYEMSHPLRFVGRSLRKVRAGSRAIAERTSKGREVLTRMLNRLDGTSGRTFGAEVVRQVLRRLVTATIELGVSLFFRRLFAPQRLTIVRPFPAPRSAI
jgi:hypothetical protein